MAYHPTSGRDPLPPAFPEAGGIFAQPGDTTIPYLDAPLPETDLADLTARFAASSGPGLSPELSAELALEIVLHEIVEQACLATGATGAAIVLERDGEMVCRASSGPTAPELGAGLDGGSGLSGECMRTGEVQRCEDAWVDPRADGEASRELGVRSVLVYPLLRENKVIGLFEAFSSRTAAFGERDEHTLEALRARVLKNVERAMQPYVSPAEENGADSAEDDPKPKFAEVLPATSGRAMDIATWALGVAVLVYAVLVGVRILQSFGPRRAGAQSNATKVRSAKVQGVSPAGIAGAQSQASSPTAPASAISRSRLPGLRTSSPASAPAGSLLVYENGKEVFRMAPQTPSQADANGVTRASSVESERIVSLTPDAAENSLVHRAEPEYPEQAREQKIQGPVVLDARIKADGTVESLKLVDGPPILADAAIAAVKQWRFKPQAVDGKQVQMQTRVTIRFTLPSD